MIEKVLHVLGVPETIVSVGRIVLTTYHRKKVLDVFTRLGIWARISGAILVAAVVITLLVPGVSVSINPSALLDAAGDAWNGIPWSKVI